MGRRHGNQERLPVVFEKCAREWLARNQALPHEWSIGPKKCRLIIPRADETGFTVEIEAETYGLHASADRWRSGAWEPVSRDETLEDLCSQFLDFVRTLLRADAWLEMRYSGRSPCQWMMTYRLEHGTKSHSTGSLFFNYFGERSKKVLQNHHLPARREPLRRI